RGGSRQQAVVAQRGGVRPGVHGGGGIMTVLSITTLELHKRVLEHGGTLERSPSPTASASRSPVPSCARQRTALERPSKTCLEHDLGTALLEQHWAGPW